MGSLYLGIINDSSFSEQSCFLQSFSVKCLPVLHNPNQYTQHMLCLYTTTYPYKIFRVYVQLLKQYGHYFEHGYFCCKTYYGY